MSDEREPTTREPASSEPDASPTSARRAVRGGAIVILVLAAIAIGSAVGSFAWQLSGGRPASTVTLATRGGPNVVTAVRDLARLESTTFHMERVIELTSTSRRMFGLLEAEDSILLVAAADVVAGVDLATMRDGDVIVDREAHTARITLPMPVVLSTRLDNEHTFVHSRRTDMLAQRSQDLETEARRQAEHTLEASAIEAGILERARVSAARTVEALVRSLGYEDVEITFRDRAASPESPILRAP